MTPASPYRTGFFLGCILSLVAAEARAAKLIAVLPLDTQYADGRMSKSAQASLEDVIRDSTAATLASQGWQVLSGETLLQQLRDNGIDPGKCQEGDCALTTAREFKADKFISGAVHFVDGTFTASVRLIDTKTGTIVNAMTLRGATATALGETFEAKARDFFTKGGMVSEGTPAPSISPAPIAEPVQQPASAEPPPPQPAPAFQSAPIVSDGAVSPPGDEHKARLSLVIDGGTWHALGQTFWWLPIGAQIEWRVTPAIGFWVEASYGPSGGPATSGLGYGLGLRWFVLGGLNIGVVGDGSFFVEGGTSSLRFGLGAEVGYVLAIGQFTLGFEVRAGYVLPDSTDTGAVALSGAIMPGFRF